MTRLRLPLLTIVAFLTLWIASGSAHQERPDRTIADFEGVDYRPWITEGYAFGNAPARGALSGQMAVEGFEGRGLASSFQGGDDATGTLTSPPFRLERSYLNFLIGGGKYPGQTSLDLLIDGIVVRSATGPNDQPGGSERLDWASWDVAGLAGREAVLRVVDRRTGGWGHISVDQIVQSDRKRGLSEISREIPAEAGYLLLPIDEKAPIRRVKVSAEGGPTREFEIKLAGAKSDSQGVLDLSPFRGKRLKIASILPVGSNALAAISTSNSLPDTSKLYHEPTRPQFHFTSKRGWLNDPNGLVYFDGEYHLFYQHNPYGWDWGNMHWGHAVSPDLLHWTELPIAITPNVYGDMAFSGSAVVDVANSSGFGDGKRPPLVAAFTSTGRGECIVFSRDRGRTWTEFAGNPVVKHNGRDPKLLWHQPTKTWVMAVYDEDAGRRDVAFYNSTDLKSWTFTSRIGGYYECPDLFELPLQGTPDRTLWILSAASGDYQLGQFDGKAFQPESPARHRVWQGNFYAAQTFSDEPKGRRVQIGWAQGIAFPGEPFNQQMNIPCELTLRPTEDGVRMFAEPVAEVASLREGPHRVTRLNLSGTGEVSSEDAVGDSFELRIDAEVGSTGSLQLTLPGATVDYDIARKILSCQGVSVSLAPIAGRIKLRILVDRNSIEVFGNEGRVAIARALARGSNARKVAMARVVGGEGGGRAVTIEVDSLRSTWP